MSDANRVRLSYRRTEEDDTPIGAAGDFFRLPITSETLQQETESANSQLIRDDRQVRDVVRTNVTAQGDVNIEIIDGVYDDVIEGALQSAAWTATITDITSSTIQGIAPNLIQSTLTNEFVTLTAGMVILMSGWASATENNDFARIISVDDVDLGGSEVQNQLTLEWITIGAESAGAALTIKASSFITNGTRQIKFIFEREYRDLTNEFVLYTGMVCNTMSVDITPGSIMTGAFNFQGQTEASATSTAVSGSLIEPVANDVQNAIDNIERIIEGGGISAFEATAFSLALANNTRPRAIIGLLGPLSYGLGTVDVTGTLTAFFSTQTLADKYLNFTTTELVVIMKDAANNRMIIELPFVKYTAGPRGAQGVNTDVILELTYSAVRHPSKDFTIRIHRMQP